MTLLGNVVQDRSIGELINDGCNEPVISKFAVRTDVSTGDKEKTAAIPQELKDRARESKEKLDQLEEDTLKVTLKGFRL